MRLGSITITRRRKVRLTIEQKVMNHLQSPDVRVQVAKMARSEVKNYLAKLAEEAEVPFPNPAGFLRGIAYALRGVSTTNLEADPDDDYEPGADAPYAVIDTLPSGHTTTCTCPDKPAGEEAGIARGDN